jgi:ribosome-associated heat shock protein Hsp15
MAKTESESDKVRLDKWLWAARFYKTRSLATEAINGGHVHLNGARVKPSRNVRLEDEVRIKKGTTEFIVHIKGLSEQRGPASVAQTLYEESEASRIARENHAEQRRLRAASGPAPQKRPDKRARRHIIRFTRRQD